jgi:Na+/proline symporter
MKYKEILANRKGVAGLEILLSLITMLFMIGIIVMVFVIGGAQLQNTLEDSVTNNATAVAVINNTYQSLGTVTDWFPTFIILGSLVVLILLVVIIITSIKRSGITEGA